MQISVQVAPFYKTFDHSVLQMALYSIVDMDERDQMLTTNCTFIIIRDLIIIIPTHSFDDGDLNV